MGKVKFISDLHFGHSNVLSFDARPFKTIGEHDSELIRRWNEETDIDDDIWILGDISWYGATKTIDLFSQLNGTKHLIIGNHDKKLLRNPNVRAMFADIYDYKEITVALDNGQMANVVLSHYPIPCFNRHYYGDYHLYGHVHTGFEYNMMQRVKTQMQDLYDKPCNMYNVGCMLPEMDYTPRTLSWIIEAYGGTQ